MNDSYSPPKTLWEVSECIEFDKALKTGDQRYVETEQARGDFSFSGLYRGLGVDPATGQLMTHKHSNYILFCGHTGCGKSTELQRLSDKLNQPHAYFTVFVDVIRQLDANNLEYSDIMLSLAKTLLDRLEKNGIVIDPVYLESLENWFNQRIEKHEKTREFALDVKAGIQAKAKLPLVAQLMASMTSAFKTNSSYKTELRRIIQDSFSDFATAFNQLIAHAEGRIQTAQKGQRILFVVDGTDRLKGADRQRLFIDNVYQLKQINSTFIYCAPIALIYQDYVVHQSFDYVSKLPMIKLAEKGGSELYPAGYEALKKLLYLRADPSLFADDGCVDLLIRYSGGHPRDLLRLLNYAFAYAEKDQFDRPSVERALKQLGEDYRRFLDDEDYALLYRIDQAPANHTENSERARHLLYNLALLEYNAYWWQSHPVIRRLAAYQHVADQPNA